MWQVSVFRAKMSILHDLHAACSKDVRQRAMVGGAACNCNAEEGGNSAINPEPYSAVFGTCRVAWSISSSMPGIDLSPMEHFHAISPEVLGILELRMVYYDDRSSLVYKSAVQQIKNRLTQGFLLPQNILVRRHEPNPGITFPSLLRDCFHLFFFLPLGRKGPACSRQGRWCFFGLDFGRIMLSCHSIRAASIPVAAKGLTQEME